MISLQNIWENPQNILNYADDRNSQHKAQLTYKVTDGSTGKKHAAKVNVSLLLKEEYSIPKYLELSLSINTLRIIAKRWDINDPNGVKECRDIAKKAKSIFHVAHEFSKGCE